MRKLIASLREGPYNIITLKGNAQMIVVVDLIGFPIYAYTQTGKRYLFYLPSDVVELASPE